MAACAHPNVKLHLYGKLAARPGRKMGHLTALAPFPNAALGLVVARQKFTDLIHKVYRNRSEKIVF